MREVEVPGAPNSDINAVSNSFNFPQRGYVTRIFLTLHLNSEAGSATNGGCLSGNGDGEDGGDATRSGESSTERKVSGEQSDRDTKLGLLRGDERQRNVGLFDKLEIIGDIGHQGDRLCDISSIKESHDNPSESLLIRPDERSSSVGASASSSMKALR